MTTLKGAFCRVVAADDALLRALAAHREALEGDDLRTMVDAEMNLANARVELGLAANDLESHTRHADTMEKFGAIGDAKAMRKAERDCMTILRQPRAAREALAQS